MYVVIMTMEGSTKMTPREGLVLVLGCGHISHIVKMHNFFPNLLLYSQAYVRQTIYVAMMTKEESDTQVTIKACGPLV